jgi:hypothetical protein
MKILYISTFDERIYKITNGALISSFEKNKINGNLFIALESLNIKIKSKNVILSNINKSKILNEWFIKNKEIIPVELGGLAIKESYPKAYEFWNYRAYGWFKKICAIDMAIQFKNDYDYFVFIDADCVFLKKIKNKIYEDIFKKHSFFYHWGFRRTKGLNPETGFFGIKTDNVSLKIFEEWKSEYFKDNFSEKERWDDAAQLAEVLPSFKNEAVDLASDGVILKNSQVIQSGPFKDYIFHNKGKTKLKI